MKQRLYKSMLTGLMILLFFASSAAQRTLDYTLDEAIDFALENNRDIRGALLAIQAANKQLWEVTAQGLPQVELTAQYQNLLDIPTQLIPGEIFGAPAGTTIPVQFGRPHNANYGVSASQLLFNGSYFVGLQASKIFLELSKENLKRQELDVKATVTNTYHLVLIAQENQNVLEQTLENLKRTQYEISEMHKEGFTESTDVKQIQITVNDIENNLRALEQQIDVALQLLKLQMGIDLDDSISLKDNLQAFLIDPQDADRSAIGFDPYKNINMQAMLTQERLLELDVRKEKTTFLPSIVGFANWRQDAQRDKFDIFDPNGTWYPTTVVGLQFQWSLFNGSAKFQRIGKAKVALQQARLKKEQVEQQLTLQHKQARAAFQSAQDRFRNSMDNRDLAQQVYNMTLEKYREGLVSSLDLTQAHNQYLGSEGQYLQAVSDLLQARTSLDKIFEKI
jgi:outer membrane protein TolC